MNKAIVLCIVFLCVVMSFTSISGNQINENIVIPSYKGNTLYVGGSGEGNYTTIQSAVDDTVDGDTVFVYNGSYDENILIDKSINLIGENRETTKIDGSDGWYHTIEIIADWVNVSKFTIKNMDGDYIYGIQLDSSNNNISNNIFIVYGCAIFLLDFSSNNTISDNKINGNFGIKGIFLLDSNDNNIIKNNFFSHKWTPLYLINSCNNVIMDNYLLNNSHGIELDDGCTNNILSGNTLIDINCCTCIGIFSSSNSNLLIGNTIKTFNSWGYGIAISRSKDNIVIGNLISNCGDGISFWDSSSNIIQCNNILKCYQYGINSDDYLLLDNNYFGIHLRDCKWKNINGYEIQNNNFCIPHFVSCSYDNIIHHNNLEYNVKNAYDKCINYWDNDYPSGGNYWTDYTGEDANDDGIGDTPYFIPGGDNEDRYPLMEPWEDNLVPIARFYWSPLHPELEEEVVFNAEDSIDYDGNINLYKWDWENDGIYDESQTSPIANHTFEELGYHQVTLLIQDNESENDTITKTLRVGNQPPNAPNITGPSQGKPGVDYDYTFVSTDPEGDDVWYHICWGDKEIIYIYGPYPSGEEITLSYNWSEKGTYSITCWARDIYNATSNTTTLEVTIPRNKAVTGNMLLLRILERFPLLQKLFLLIK